MIVASIVVECWDVTRICYVVLMPSASCIQKVFSVSPTYCILETADVIIHTALLVLQVNLASDFIFLASKRIHSSFLYVLSSLISCSTKGWHLLLDDVYC